MSVPRSRLKDTGERLIPDLVSPTDELTSRLLEQHLIRYREAKALAAGRRVLDIASGSGFGTQLLAQSGAQSVLGIDCDPAIVDYARRRYSSPRLEYVCGEIGAAANARFELITCLETLEHVRQPDAFLRQLYDRLEPSGALFLSATTVETTALYRFHLHDFTPAELRALAASAGFEVVSELSQSFRVGPAAVRRSILAHPQAGLPTRGLRRPLAFAKRVASACLFDGLTYENLMLRLSRSA